MCCGGSIVLVKQECQPGMVKVIYIGPTTTMFHIGSHYYGALMEGQKLCAYASDVGHAYFSVV